MNLHSVTPKDLKEFQLQKYTELLKNPRSEKHERFLKQQIKLLSGNITDNNNRIACNNLFSLRHIPDMLRQERIKGRFRDQKF